MSFREIVNDNSKIAIGLIGLVIVGALVFTYMQLQGGPSIPDVSDKSFYTIDDGKTWFVDAADMMPFSKDGKPAYLAFVFKGEDGKEVVGFMKRYRPDLEKSLADKSVPNYQNLVTSPGATQVKEPGSTQWVSTSSTEGLSLVAKWTKALGSKFKPVAP